MSAIVPAANPAPGVTPPPATKRPLVIGNVSKFNFEDLDKVVFSHKSIDPKKSKETKDKKPMDYLAISMLTRMPGEDESKGRICVVDFPRFWNEAEQRFESVVSHTGIHPEYGTIGIAINVTTDHGKMIVEKLTAFKNRALDYILSIYNLILAQGYLGPSIPSEVNRRIVTDSRIGPLFKSPKNNPDSEFQYFSLDVGFCNFGVVPVKNGVYDREAGLLDVPHEKLHNKGIEMSCSLKFTGVNITKTPTIAIKLSLNSAIIDNIVAKVSINDQSEAYNEKITGGAPVVDVLSQLQEAEAHEAKTVEEETQEIERLLEESRGAQPPTSPQLDKSGVIELPSQQPSQTQFTQTIPVQSQQPSQTQFTHTSPVQSQQPSQTQFTQTQPTYPQSQGYDQYQQFTQSAYPQPVNNVAQQLGL